MVSAKITLPHNALIHLTETIKEALDQGKYGCGIFVDPQKAYDTADLTFYCKAESVWCYRYSLKLFWVLFER